MQNYTFFTPIKIRYGDLDPQGHVNNARFLTFFEHARVHYLRELGLFHEDQSFLEIGIIIANINISYHQPLQWKEKIKVGMRTQRIGNKSIITEQCVVSEDEKTLFASGTVTLVMFDYHADQSVSVPKHWRDVIATYENAPVTQAIPGASSQK